MTAAAFTHVRANTDDGLGRPAPRAGLFAGLLVLFGLIVWLAHDAARDVSLNAGAREAVVLAEAAASAVAAAPPGEVAARLTAVRDAVGLPRASLRFALIEGKSLAAAVSPEGAEGVPRALTLDEKPLYDSALRLRAARLADPSATAPLVRRHADAIAAQAPVIRGDAVVGVLEARLPARAHAGPLVMAIAGGAALVVGLLGLPLIGRLNGLGPWLAPGVAVAAGLIAGFVLAGQLEFAAAGAAAEVAAVDEAAAALRGGSSAGATSGAGFEVTRFAAQAAADARASLWAGAVLAALIAAFVAFGWAGKLLATLREHRTAYLYLAPAMIGMLVLSFFPFFYGFALSFTDTTLLNAGAPYADRWIGLDNYIRILSDFALLQETSSGAAINYENFYWTLFITVIWTVSNVAVGVGLGLAFALVLNTKGLAGRSIYRVLLILPWAVPNYITALTWKGMFHPQFGVINQALAMFGLEPVRWFDGVWTSFLTGLVTNGWLSFPFMMVVCLGALQSVSEDMYEAARLDGANAWQRFRHITWPSLQPALLPAIVISIVWTFNMFNVIYLVSAGEPGGATEILVTQAYKFAFEEYRYGYAAAYSVVIFAILLGYGVFQNRVSRATEGVR